MSCVDLITMNTLAVTTLAFALLVYGQQPGYHSQPFEGSSQDNHHNRDVHGRSYPGNGAIVFSDVEYRTSLTTYNANATKTFKTTKIPLSFMKMLSNVSSVDEVFRRYVKNVGIKLENSGAKRYLATKDGKPLYGSNNEKILISETTHETNTPDGNHMRVAVLSERTASKPQRITQSAACQPEPRTVELSVKFDPHIIYIPRCVRLERCGGCCATNILSCEPVASEIKPVEVLVNKFAYIGDDKTEEMSFLEQESVMMEQHTKCECKCRVKEQDCSSRHEYIEDECQCVCRNREDHEKCSSQRHKIWDPNTCECSCREIKDCNSGFVFSLRSCKCELLPSALDTTGRRGRKRRNHNITTTMTPQPA